MRAGAGAAASLANRAGHLPETTDEHEKTQQIEQAQPMDARCHHC
jgi:hypothetical protein